MKLRIHSGKIVSLVVMTFIYIMGMLAMTLSDTLQVTRYQLTRFYKTSFDSCTIQKLESVPYPGRGNYNIFYTSCQDAYYPVLLQRNIDTDLYDLFKENVTISKDSNSLEVQLFNHGDVYNLRIRDPNDEDDRGFGVKVFLVFIGIVSIILLVTPNSYFEKMK